MSSLQITVYYDGLCHLCSREMNHYRKHIHADRINFIDITAEQFNAKTEGLDPVKVQKIMHVKNSSGELRTGVDGFIDIWTTLSTCRLATKLISVWPIYPLAKLGYWCFASLRPYLPKKKRCEL